VLAAVAGVDDRRVLVAARLLGARHLLEAGVWLRAPGARRWCRRVDALHLLTMAAALAVPELRRPAAISLIAGTTLLWTTRR
jgi:hypothetical protein